MLNEITLILDTLLRSRHLPVETCHPHVQFSSSPTGRNLPDFKGTPPRGRHQMPDYWAVTERRVDAVPTPPALVAATLTKYVAPVVRDGMVQVRPALVAEQEDTAVPPVDAV